MSSSGIVSVVTVAVPGSGPGVSSALPPVGLPVSSTIHMNKHGKQGKKRSISGC